MKLSKILSSVAISAALVFTGTGIAQATPVNEVAGPNLAVTAQGHTVLSPSDIEKTSSVRGQTLDKIRNSGRVVKEVNPGVLKSKLRNFESKAPAMYKFLKALDQSGEMVSYFAATTTDSDLRELGARLKGRHFVLKYDQITKQAHVTLVEGSGEPQIDSAFAAADNGRVTTQATQLFNWKCPKALAAFIAWTVGFGMLCFPAGPVGSVACTVLFGVVFTPDFNTACK